MNVKNKVYGTGILFYGQHRKQVRHIVAAPNRKEAARLFKMRPCEAKDFISETGNKSEVETALKHPGVVLVNVGDYYNQKFEPKQ